VIERRDSRSKNTIALCKPSSWFISCLADLLWLAALSHPLLTLVNGAWFRCNLVASLSVSIYIHLPIFFSPPPQSFQCQKGRKFPVVGSKGK
jgi:hypothetical protein